jgi:hypothetical protein
MCPGEVERLTPQASACRATAAMLSGSTLWFRDLALALTAVAGLGPAVMMAHSGSATS